MKISRNYHTSCTSFHPPLVVYNLKLEPGWGGFLSACLLQIVLKFIPSTHRPRRKTLKSIFKRNCSLLLRIEPFRKSPFCCVQYLPLVFTCILSHSIFTLQMGLGLPHLLAEAGLGLPPTNSRHSTIWGNMVNKVMSICRKCFHKKLTSICW